MLGIRQKLMLGFGGLLVTIAVIGVLTMTQIGHLGQEIDVILRENYRSVIACQEMKEALERMDSGVLFSFAGNTAEGRRYIDENTRRFRAALGIERGNITLPGEQDKANRIRDLFEEYSTSLPLVTTSESPVANRQQAYFGKVLPVFQEIKGLAQDILEMNQANMSAANDNARHVAAAARQQMLSAILICALIAILFIFFIQRWILRPLGKLIESTDEIRRGHLDLVLDTHPRDEIGRLSESFNEMASALRHTRKQDQLDLTRTKQATEQVFKALPAAIAIVKRDGVVEFATETAARHFGMKPGISIESLNMGWLRRIVARAIDEGRLIEGEKEDRWIQQFIEGHEYFFQPMAIPLPAGPHVVEPTGTAIILKDVTQVHEQQELKRGVVATVSHQLKTPLQSLRMSIHLLLEERVGKLNEKQMELACAAKEESERLKDILDDLLDLDRIGSDRSQLQVKPVAPVALAREGVEPFLTDAKDSGVTLVNAVSEDLPDVIADSSRLRHVFGNLLSNALRFTQPGGSITIGATLEADAVRFTIEDTGAGVAPEHVNRLFEPFFRAPGQDEQGGVGLGLAIVREIVQAHRGTVSAQSEIGKGTRFCFTLPVRTNRQDDVTPRHGEEYDR